MQQYLDLLEKLKTKGAAKKDRTNTGTASLFSQHMRFNLAEGFPLMTTKKIHFKSVVHELLWFLKGDTNVKYLQDNGVKIWDEWATKEQTARFNRPEGELGAVYGHQWRNFGATEIKDKYGCVIGYEKDGFDQISWVINEIKTNPSSRRLIVSGWNPKEANEVALPPCHTLFQFYVENDTLSCALWQRSADVFLGVPFNIASYALLTCMIAQVCGLKVGEFCWSGGDTHLYSNHFDQAELQLSREPKKLCELWLNPEIKDIFDFKFEDINVLNYEHHSAIKAPVAV